MEEIQKKESPKSKLTNLFGRNIIWVALILVSLFMLVFSPEVIWATFYITLGEGLAMAFSAMALFAYTHIPFVKMFENGSDPLTKIANSIVMASVFIGVHFLVGYSMYGIYLASK